MRIAMIGSGYVGLTTGACLASLGHAVRCHDIDRERVELLQRGQVPIFEPGLAETIAAEVAAGRLRFSTSATTAVAEAEIVMLAVGTPSKPDGDIDLSQVEAAARMLAPHVTPGAVVVIKSTVSVGTAKRIREVIAEARGALDFSVASNPEFLREGSAVQDFLCPDRIVIGADDRQAALALQRLYEKLAARGVPILVTATANAELVKHAANAFLALKIGFINDVADLCEQAGADILAVAEGIGLDSRVGRHFLVPGPGYGGSCFPKDTRAFAATARRHGAPQPLIDTLIGRNEERKRSLAARVIAGLGDRSRHVCVLGVAFKKNTDDIRESPAVTIIEELLEAGIAVTAHDPRAASNGRENLPAVRWCDTPYEAAGGCAAIVIAAEWDEYRELDLERLAAAMSGRLLFDFRNLLDPAAATEAGFLHEGLGRSSQRPKQRQKGLGGGPAPERKVAAPGVL